MTKEPAMFLFQSHYGLILSCLWISFCNTLWAFQSHYGLILSGFTPERDQKIVNPFNPTMVWFYHRLFFQFYAENLFNFQSHYGLILSVLFSCFFLAKYSLSIPLWSDFIKILTATGTVTGIGFQSHYGLILSCMIYK